MTQGCGFARIEGLWSACKLITMGKFSSFPLHLLKMPKFGNITVSVRASHDKSVFEEHKLRYLHLQANTWFCLPRASDSEIVVFATQRRMREWESVWVCVTKCREGRGEVERRSKGVNLVSFVSVQEMKLWDYADAAFNIQFPPHYRNRVLIKK